MSKRVLALDVGTRRIGVAVSDPLGYTAQGIDTIVRRNTTWDLEQISNYMAQYETDMVLVGLPRNMRGEESEQTRYTRGFMDLLTQRGFHVIEWDERLTTAAARRTLIEAGVSRQKRKDSIDKLAAVWILQSFLDSGGLTRINADQRRGKEGSTMHDGTMDQENIVELMDENDNAVRFEHLMTIEHEGSEYVLLVPLDPVDDIEEDELVILRIDPGEEEDAYVGIEDEELMQTIFQKYLEMTEDMEDGDE